MVRRADGAVAPQVLPDVAGAAYVEVPAVLGQKVDAALWDRLLGQPSRALRCSLGAGSSPTGEDRRGGGGAR